jgi:tetratricopeptide (TPR) repeat protein
MNRFSSALSIASLLSLVCIASAQAQNAKDVFSKALSASDPCQREQFACEAAKLDPKKKDYSDACAQATHSVSSSDDNIVRAAQGLFDKGDYQSAAKRASFVCKLNPTQYAQAQEIIHEAADKTKVAVAPPAPAPAAPQPTPTVAKVEQPAPTKPTPEVVKLETPAPAPANQPTPKPVTNDTAAKTPPPAAIAKNQPAKPVENPADVAARFVAEGDKARAAGKLQDALKSYEAALHIDSNNIVALAGKNAVQTIINSDPAEQAKTLAQAIRDFYEAKYSEAQDELASYLSSTNVKSRGVAHFYMAAARLSRMLVDRSSTAKSTEAALHDPDVQRLFRQSKGEQYKPLERYVSPLIMDAWRGAGTGP